MLCASFFDYWYNRIPLIQCNKTSYNSRSGRLVYDQASLQVKGLAHSPQFQDSSTLNILRSKQKMNEFMRCKIMSSLFVVYVKLFLSGRVVENMQAITTICYNIFTFSVSLSMNTLPIDFVMYGPKHYISYYVNIQL